MKTIRSVLEKHIGFFSFLLVFVVLYTGSIRGLLAADLSSHEVVHLKSNQKDQSDVHQQHLTISNAVGQVKTLESEIDEVHLDYIFPKSVFFTFISVENQLFDQILNGTKAHRLPLYDLFCNWKIHLS
ncbi:hypothetical protein HUU42_08395 [bacterium]|nr:hypothetical protein [bacterium]